MESLEHPDCLYLSAAQGWFELGNLAEATAELERITPSSHAHPEVLELRWQIRVKQQDWTGALEIAEKLCQLAPESPFGWIHRSYCLHELKKTQEAWDSLTPVAEKFSKDWLLCYNLACYACQLGHLEEAKSWFNRALQMGDAREIGRLASQDPDLKPLLQSS